MVDAAIIMKRLVNLLFDGLVNLHLSNTGPECHEANPLDKWRPFGRTLALEDSPAGQVISHCHSYAVQRSIKKFQFLVQQHT